MLLLSCVLTSGHRGLTELRGVDEKSGDRKQMRQGGMKLVPGKKNENKVKVKDTNILQSSVEFAFTAERVERHGSVLCICHTAK